MRFDPFFSFVVTKQYLDLVAFHLCNDSGSAQKLEFCQHFESVFRHLLRQFFRCDGNVFNFFFFFSTALVVVVVEV